MARLMRLIDRLNSVLAEVLGWCTFAMVVVTCAVVLLRYLFSLGNLIFVQELVIYLHASIFMLGAGWVLMQDRHVRVDIFYRRAGTRARAWINALGTLLFLFPVGCFLLLSSQSFVQRSWALLEGSPEPGGIAAVYLLKTLIPLMAVLLLLQGLAELIRSARVLLAPPDTEMEDD